MKKPDRPFTKIGNELLLELGPLVGAEAAFVYMILLQHTREARLCWPSVRRVAALIGKSRSSAARYIGRLIDADLVRVTESDGQASQYWLVPEDEVLERLRNRPTGGTPVSQAGRSTVPQAGRTVPLVGHTVPPMGRAVPPVGHKKNKQEEQRSRGVEKMTPGPDGVYR